MTAEQASSIRFGIFILGLVVFLIAELIVPYRPSTVPKWKRWVTNISLTAFNSILLNLIFAGAVWQTAQYVTQNGQGVLNLLYMPQWLKVFLTVVFMDFMLYIWHLLNHEVPFLWRFHRVHHTDLNMDVSTATRFHTGELAISALIKISLVYFLGASPLGVVIFESALVLCAQFHHSSLVVPAWFEKYYWLLFVPPSMHRIHHSVIIKERDTNYGTIFSLWDRILNTMKAQVDQSRIRIGVGAYPHPDKLNLVTLLTMPVAAPVR